MICGYCGKEKEADMGIYVSNPAWAYQPMPICDECATTFYGGYKIEEGIATTGNDFVIPTDPMLKYLEKIDPMEEK